MAMTLSDASNAISRCPNSCPRASCWPRTSDHAAGLLLQKLPGASGAGLGEGEAAAVQELWEEASALLATRESGRAAGREADELLLERVSRS